MSLRRSSLCVAVVLTLLLTPALLGTAPTQAQLATAYIVQSDTAASAAALTTAAGGRVTQELAIIDGVAAQLDAGALARLQADSRVRLHIDAPVRNAALPLGSEPAVQRPGRPTNLPTPDPNTNPSEGPGSETFSANQLLYPSAATGAYLMRPPYAPAVNTPNLRCHSQQVEAATGTSAREVQGWGVTVAVIDSGFEGLDAKQWKSYDSASRTLYTENKDGRCLVYRDFLPANSANGNLFTGAPNSVDQNGHGTHVASTIADDRLVPLSDGVLPTSVGVAPKVNLLIARALDKDGSGSYATVIAAIEWVVQNKDRYRVRVLNLSLHAPVAGPYWADPMNQAVMKAWQAGIVVVVSAGNAGPSAGTIAAPGNVPYVITVGAIKSGRYTQDGRDDLATYSSRGPTESAFVKPDVVVPASRTIAPMPDDSTLARQLQQLCGPGSSPDKPCIQTKAAPDYGFGPTTKQQSYYYLSGTSMAAAEVSGLVALLLQTNPQLTNDQVKWRLLSTARPNIDQTTGKPTYSPWEQGAGLVDIRAAARSTSLDRANGGMDIAQDLVVTGSPQTHYWGSTIWDSTAGEFRLVSPTSGQPLAVWSGATRVWIDATRV
ncbi:MAG TPA: S8 family peptidase, partial [Roseiflexaceae bacterium]|nr:S8 family peptidase [Roseiflexaceae bacterium]